MTRIAANEKRIASQLGLSPAGLRVLAVAVAKGVAPGGISAKRLAERGLLRPRAGLPWQREITPVGRALVERARAMGW